jgi:anti-sigma-K factor RskA
VAWKLVEDDMNETRFMELLGVYGAELARWPEDDRHAAAAFLEVAPHRIKDVWESERKFDHLLMLEKDAPASIALEARIFARVPERRAFRRLREAQGLWSMPKWAAGGALAASLALGFAVGYAGEPQTAPPSDYASMLTLSGGGAGSVLLTAMNDGGN